MPANPARVNRSNTRPNGADHTDASATGPGIPPGASVPPAAPADAPPARGARRTGVDEKRTSLNVLLTDDGRADLDRMRPDTRAAFEKAARSLPASDSAEPMDLPPFVGQILGDLVASIDAGIVRRIARVPADDAELNSVIQWTQAERDQLAPLVSRIAAKYGGTLMAKWGEELMLLAVLSAITMQKVSAVRDLVKSRALAGASPAPAPAATSTPVV